MKHLNHRIFWATILYLTVGIFAQSDKQRCYYDSGELAPDYIIPCYTSTSSEHYSCCKVGNKCLRENACYDHETGVTYQYGCTDKNYGDKSCPQKCGLSRENSNWVGLVFCNGSKGTPNNTWVCHHPDNCGKTTECRTVPWDPNLKKLPAQRCEDLKHGKEYVAFQHSSSIFDLVPLPPKTELASYLSAHPLPTTTTTTANAASSTAIAAPTGTDQSLSAHPKSTIVNGRPGKPLPPDSESRRTSMIFALGLGIPGLLGAVGFSCYYIYLRRRRAEAEKIRRRGKSLMPSNNVNAVEPGYTFKAELPGEDIPMIGLSISPAKTDFGGTTLDERSPNSTPFVSPTQSEFTDKGQPNANAQDPSEISGNEIYELPA
ncbi:hypothetical protein BDV95DRAFT_604864 [Massariosphaeria phaeospora]|uniref:Uncharacterized protein n=1 Tax=Massariosphaeria phaeospora TaxID=100035 RepID=A0A7C8MCN0_9PLEO|nr:hypothetical protein BDV95DRAFT_604864 [Massariosphaeria phaeospora]